MIFDDLKNMETYRGLDERIFEGLSLLNTGILTKPDGRYEVRGDDLYYMIQTYETKPDNLPEAHKRYVDIQHMISGGEVIGVGNIDEMLPVEAHPERDFYLFQGRMDAISLLPGKFAIFWPHDAHAPAIALQGQPAVCHKCVIKVRIE